LGHREHQQSLGLFVSEDFICSGLGASDRRDVLSLEEVGRISVTSPVSPYRHSAS
jgi:hypothetical protein